MNKNNLPTVLVTGGAGYIGSHTVLALCDQGYPVVVVDNLCTGFLEAVDKRAVVHVCDIADKEAVRTIIRDHKITAIMHFAGSVVVPESVENPIKYYYNNSVNTLGLIDVAAQEGVEGFVFSSTAATYGIPDTIPVHEDMGKHPINPYGYSKLCSEVMLRDVSATCSMHHGILRYFNVAGADPQMRSGQRTKNATHLIKITSEHLCGKRPEIHVFGTDYPTPDGSGIRDYIHVSDLADIHVAALAHILSTRTSLTMNCGYGTGYSVLEVLNVAQQVTGKPMNIIHGPRRAGDPPALISDCTRLRELLQWQPRYHDLAFIIKTAYEWEQNNL
ncbi:MAG: UDP-glucose 4-epimerase GalE [Alphaproteobacteria bacterium]|nr:MAG: UDP-glucose 4-epimerase GalE [Alphaproteobacteria bacterium]TAF13306.1 MAG: UDP-glucose 4-epimerase GalE [Alphaproteobacteria bacterium]